MTVTEDMKTPFTTSKDAFEVFKAVMDQAQEQDSCKERFYIAGLNTKNVINYIELVSMGTLHSSLVHPREVFRFAIIKNSSSIIACHNHPSGVTDPSKDDLAITKRLRETGKVIGINLLDHLIIANNGYLSLFEKGYMA